MSKKWSTEELRAAVVAYKEMRSKELAGEPFVKSDYYRGLVSAHGRTEKAWGYRMSNISFVYDSMGLHYLKGLKPLSHVGANVAHEIKELINEAEGKPLIGNEAEFEAQVEKLLSSTRQEKPKGNNKPVKTNENQMRFKRSADVVAWVLRRAHGKCENCGNNAPFVKENNLPFLEVHHLVRLADGGADIISNAVAVCPNCHRELHYGKNRVKLTDSLKEKLKGFA